MPTPTPSSTATALWYTAPGRAALLTESLPALGPGDVLVRSLYSGMSRGTESLVYHGRVPAAEHARMRAPHQGGAFPFPVKYGYASVGVVEAGSETLNGQTVFALHPHQDRFVLPAQAVMPLPGGLPPRRAVLAANMETALNALWDAGAGPAMRVAVIGGGVVGLLTAFLAARLPGAEVTLVDLEPARATVASALGCRFAPPAGAPEDCDLVFHTSASAAGLGTALGCAGDEARVMEMSWYGTDNVATPLGSAFHARRLQLISAQVGKVSPYLRPRWDYRRRLAAALDLLADPRLDILLEAPCALADLPAQLPDILRPGGTRLAQVISYP